MLYVYTLVGLGIFFFPIKLNNCAAAAAVAFGVEFIEEAIWLQDVILTSTPPPLPFTPSPSPPPPPPYLHLQPESREYHNVPNTWYY